MTDLRPAARSVLLAAALGLGACASATGGEPFSPTPRPTAEFPNIGYATWTEEEPSYRFYPGDEVEVSTPSAPELNKVVTVGLDGRISLPLIDPVMAADRTPVELRDALRRAYDPVLVDPRVDVAVKSAQPLKVFVGGEVDKAGVYDMPGDINALQAIIQAGGFKGSARRDRVIVIRRGPDGRPMMRTVDLKRGIYDPANAETVPLRRFDIVYVPRTGLADAGLFIQQIRDLIPFNTGFSYAINPQVYSSGSTN
jgi:protein involved in polysaccharide export with SLBB domain